MQGSDRASQSWNGSELSCTDRQRQAILHTVGPAGVLAGPGSGKTFVITHRIHRLITAEGVDPSHILVITFTKAAALEMQERFFRLMGTESPPGTLWHLSRSLLSYLKAIGAVSRLYHYHGNGETEADSGYHTYAQAFSLFAGGGYRGDPDGDKQAQNGGGD